MTAVRFYVIVRVSKQKKENLIVAIKIRLTRLGDKKSPFYRVVVADARVARDGKYIEQIGTYNPLTNPAEIKINNSR